MTKKNIAIFTGATGGHIFPAIAVMEELLADGYTIHFFVDKARGVNFIKDVNIFSCNELLHVHTLSITSKRNTLLGYVKYIVDIIRDVLYCLYILQRSRARLSLCFGSYVSAPGVIATVLLFKKLVIHEQNTVLSDVNRIASYFAKNCLLAYNQTMRVPRYAVNRCLYVGNPIRSKVRALAYQNDNSAIGYIPFFKIYDRINILILGGSQGTSIFTKLLSDVIANLAYDLRQKVFVYHQCRAEDVDFLSECYVKCGVGYSVRTFFDNVGELMSCAHVLFSRSGYTVSEIALLGVPSILIPLPNSKNNHQYYNAKYLRDNGAAILLDQSSISTNKVITILEKLFYKDYMLSELSQRAKILAMPDSHVKIHCVINFLLGYGKPLSCNTKPIDIIRTIKDNVGLG